MIPIKTRWVASGTLFCLTNSAAYGIDHDAAEGLTRICSAGGKTCGGGEGSLELRNQTNRWGWRAYDIAVFRWEARLSEKEKERWPTFLEGYKEVRQISERDHHATADFVALRHLWLLGLHTSNGDAFGCGWMNDRYFDRSMKFFRAWAAEYLAEEPIA